jgi:glycosyltransferase involved in cell wall biosynthesis
MKPENRAMPAPLPAPEGCAESAATDRRPAIAICSPALDAVSGVSTHANLLLGSVLARHFRLIHFQVGSEGRQESAAVRAVRTLMAPLSLVAFLLRERPAILHLNTSMALKPLCRDTVLAAVARVMRIAVISQIHGGLLPQELVAGRSGLPRLLRGALGLNSAVVVLSQQELTAYRQFSPSLRIECIPNAIDPVAYAGQSQRGGNAYCNACCNACCVACCSAARTASCNRLQDRACAAGCPRAPSPQVLRLLYVGRLIPEKGLFEALDAIALLVSAGRRLAFTIAGSG